MSESMTRKEMRLVAYSREGSGSEIVKDAHVTVTRL